MAATDEESNLTEASGSDAENKANNNFGKRETSESRSRNPLLRDENEKRKKFFHHYIYQQDYEEALRSLLWEPYDCRDDSGAWFCRGLDNEPGAVLSEVPKRNFSSSSEWSATSSSSCSSLDEILTVEMTQNSAFHSEKRYSFNINVPRNLKERSASRKVGRVFKARELVLEEKEEQFLGVFSERTSNPVQNQTNIEIMVSDLHFENENGGSSCCVRGGAQKSHGTEIGASASQYELDRCSEVWCACDRVNNDLNTADKMLVTVEGTLEPRDSNEGTHLVSPDTSLDLNDNPVRVTRQNRTEPGPSNGNVSVVNCYRAVPVSVVSTVPTIKCLNTQENVSNINIIQTSSNAEQKLKKRMLPQAPEGPAPSTSRVRSKISNKDKNRFGQNNSGNTDGASTRESPEQILTPSSLHYNGPFSSAGLSNHSRSVSNPVLGNQTKPVPNRFGSQQNIPIRLETHFGPNSLDGAEHSQTYLTRNVPNGETPTQQQQQQSQQQQQQQQQNMQGVDNSKLSPRTFTSTEAQTDDVPLGVHTRSVINREQRRRERRERRHQRRLHQSVLNSGGVWQTNVDMVPRDRRGLPDILNSHMPPPYSAVSMPAIPAMPPPMHLSSPIPLPPTTQTVPHLVDSPPGQPLPHQNGLRFSFPLPRDGRRSQSQMFAHEEDTPKSCCGVAVTQTVSIRWFIVMISFVGICCVIVGTVLGAMKASGREHLTVSLLMIGVGIVLVTVSVVAWRLTSQDAPSCRSMLGLGNADDSGNEPNQRFVPRMPPSYGRPHHPYAAMMYPEFQYRPPPPSYQASMQEYRLRLLLLERPNDAAAGLQAAMSPPPTYRSQPGSTLGLRVPQLCRSLPQSEYSHPPSYRSRTSSTRPTLDPNGDTLGSVSHSRNSSLLSHVSDQNGNVSQAVVNVISVMGNAVDLHRGDTDLQIDSIKIGVEEEVPIPPLRMVLNKGKRSPAASSDDAKSENLNLVTIVTVTDGNSAPGNRDHSVESDVLAHL